MVEVPDFDEIRSHSSMLTNMRIDLIFKRMDLSIEEVWTNPCIPNITSYHSVLRNAFLNFQAILDDDQVEEISLIFQNFLKKYYTAILTEKVALKSVYEMVNELDRINSLMRYYLQLLSYFFKMGKSPIRGFERALEVVKQGGGIFGGIPIEIEEVPLHKGRPRRKFEG